MRTPLRALAAATVATLAGAACSTSTEPRIDPDVLAAAQTFDRLADSLTTAGADASVSSAYRAVSRVVMSSSRLSSVSISVDGVAADFFATAQAFQFYPPCPPGAMCASILGVPLRSMVAWQRSDPRRIVQLTADLDTPIGAVLGSSSDPFSARATLTFLDGAGGAFLGTSGTQSITYSPGAEPCTAPITPAVLVDAMPHTTCTRADFTVSFDGMVQPPSFALRKNTAAGSHTIAMSPQHVLGSLLVNSCVACSGEPVPGPPIVIAANSSMVLTSLGITSAAADVAFVFTVTNSSTAPVQLDFPSSQQYDFVVRSNTTGALAWQWSAGKAFATMLTSRTLAAGETVTFTEHWKPTAAGAYSAQAVLTSSSHRATASTGFTVP
jgi:hypothetical protein